MGKDTRMNEFDLAGTYTEADVRVGPADADTVAAFRRHIRDWLDTAVDLDDEKLSDIVLSTDEALSNCADHAYRDMIDDGNMALQTSYDLLEGAITVCITDFGRWTEPEDRAGSRRRGRGLVLMRALADECHVDGGAHGTTVRLRFTGCRARLPATGAPTN
jgi:serine/threonine-protein kinase RsbW